jgi:acyl-CoA synthetase (AMP-forming)/AMP-acid ligase II
VSTNEVAEVINTFKGVAETTVYGVQIPGTEGRAGMASMVLHGAVEDFDLAGLVRHLEDQLPVYAQPLFLRFQKELEVTGTFKQVKGDLKEQGFDLGKVSDPIYLMLPRSREYVRLTEEILGDIMAEKVAF